jgi:hypothetical protein
MKRERYFFTRTWVRDTGWAVLIGTVLGTVINHFFL